MKMTLAQMRINADYTQKEAANSIGVTPQTVSNWERCKTTLKISQYVSLCSLYHCTVNDIFLLES